MALKRTRPKMETKVRGFKSMHPAGEKQKRVDEIVDVLELGAEYTQMRLIGDVWPYATHWISIKTQKGVINIPKVVPNFDPKTDTFDETIEDPYKFLDNEVQTSKRYFVNAIVRELQENEPRKRTSPTSEEERTGWKSKDSRTWTPVRVLSIPSSAARSLQKLIGMNTYRMKSGKVVEKELSDPRFGCDIFISYDANEAGTSKYSVQKGDRTPLTDDEQGYLLWDLSNLMEAETPEEARADAQRLAEKNPKGENEDEEEVDLDEVNDILLNKKRNAAKKRGAPKPRTKRPAAKSGQTDDGRKAKRERIRRAAAAKRRTRGVKH